MLHEFLYDYKVYAVVEAGQFISSKNKNRNRDRHVVEIFKTLGDIQTFFRRVAQDPISRDDILRIAEWVKPTYCRPAKNSSKPDSQELLNLLSLRVYNGAYLLVEIKPPLEFKECCAKSLKEITTLLNNSKFAAKWLCIAQVNSIFSSHSKLPAITSVLSSAYDVTVSTDWKEFGNAFWSLKKSTIKTIENIAGIEVAKHMRDNNRELQKYWQRIFNDTTKAMTEVLRKEKR